MTLDPYLTYDEHIINTVSTRFGNKIILTILKTLVFSKLYYCSNVWANTSRNNIQKLQAVQNFARRITSGTRKNDQITPSLKELRWLTVASELFYRSAITAFKCMSGCAPEYLSTQFIKRTEVSNRRTRNSQKTEHTSFKNCKWTKNFLLQNCKFMEFP